MSEAATKGHVGWVHRSAGLHGGCAWVCTLDAWGCRPVWAAGWVQAGCSSSSSEELYVVRILSVSSY